MRYFPEAYILYARIHTMCKILATLTQADQVKEVNKLYLLDS
jgi:hypothetical protein